ncbi:MAG: hypothetical protein ACRDZQ_13560 [Acidimicrobiales bacterium]
MVEPEGWTDTEVPSASHARLEDLAPGVVVEGLVAGQAIAVVE